VSELSMMSSCTRAAAWKISSAEAKQIAALKIDGITTAPDVKRIYPRTWTASQVLGGVNNAGGTVSITNSSLSGNSAVEAGAGHHVVTCLGNIEDGNRFGGLSRAQQQCRKPALQTGDALLHGILRGVADAGVDGCELREGKPVGGGFGTREDERRRLVNRERTCPGGAVRLLASVDLAGFERPSVRHSRLLDVVWNCAVAFSVGRLP